MEYLKTIKEYSNQALTDLIFDTNDSIVEIAEQLGRTPTEIRKYIKELGLGWVRRSRGQASRGQAALTVIMRKLLPGERIISEYPLGERLKLDVYCPRYELAAEYHGQQHYEYNSFFHGDREGFLLSQQRDNRKLEICRDLGIALVVFRYTDELTEEAVYERLLHAIQTTPRVKKEPRVSRYKGNPYYEAYKQRQREYRKQAYRKMKKANGKRS